ncbi:MAG: hypothetical protein WC091_19915 [Sulfuricellaceae bacterium]
MAPTPFDQKPLNLNDLVANRHIDLSIVPQESPEDAAHRRKKDMIVFIAALGSIALVLLVSLGALFFASIPSDDKKVLGGVVVSITTGLIGFALGKKH